MKRAQRGTADRAAGVVAADGAAAPAVAVAAVVGGAAAAVDAVATTSDRLPVFRDPNSFCDWGCTEGVALSFRIFLFSYLSSSFRPRSGKE